MCGGISEKYIVFFLSWPKQYPTMNHCSNSCVILVRRCNCIIIILSHDLDSEALPTISTLFLRCVDLPHLQKIELSPNVKLKGECICDHNLECHVYIMIVH